MRRVELRNADVSDSNMVVTLLKAPPDKANTVIDQHHVRPNDRLALDVGTDQCVTISFAPE